MGINSWWFLLFLHFSKFKVFFSSHLLLHISPFLSPSLFSFLIMSTGANPSRKRKYRPRNPPGPDRAEINWKEEEFQNLVCDMGFRS
ncbi:hypothetical protein Hanom_Chr12g01126991 [Helianthus anomalus]